VARERDHGAHPDERTTQVQTDSGADRLQLSMKTPRCEAVYPYASAGSPFWLEWLITAMPITAVTTTTCTPRPHLLPLVGDPVAPADVPAGEP
jgi:hypothetical protein